MATAFDLYEDLTKSSETSEQNHNLSETGSDYSNTSSCHITRSIAIDQPMNICQDFQVRMVCSKGKKCPCVHQHRISDEGTLKPRNRFHLLNEYPEVAISQSSVRRINSLLFS